MKINNKSSWAAEEFTEVKLGDKRLDARLIKLCDRLQDAPESPINQACVDWAETKAAYRFIQNKKVEVDKMLAAHRYKTAQRAKEYNTVLAIQDTSYFVYTNHPKTEGLGKMSMKKGKNVKEIYSNGLIMHTPSIGIVVIWIAKLGGYLARKSDGLPGTITLWRGWKRLIDMSEGLKLADKL